MGFLKTAAGIAVGVVGASIVKSAETSNNLIETTAKIAVGGALIAASAKLIKPDLKEIIGKK